jgi:hypothetical protein
LSRQLSTNVIILLCIVIKKNMKKDLIILTIYYIGGGYCGAFRHSMAKTKISNQTGDNEDKRTYFCCY